MRDFNTASNEYKLGRLGRKPYGMDKWNNPALADYAEGKADRAKLNRKARRQRTIDNTIFAILAVIASIVGTVIYAFVVALPWMLVALFVWLIVH